MSISPFIIKIYVRYMPLYIVWEILTRISIHYYNLQFHIFLKKKKKKITSCLTCVVKIYISVGFS